MAHEVPSIFVPVVLRSGIKFRRLKGHFFTAKEIVFLCQLMSHEHGAWPYKLASIRALSRRHHLPEEGLKFWWRSYKNGNVFENGQQCLPPVLDCISARRFAASINNRKGENITDLFAVELEKTARRRAEKLAHVHTIVS